MIKKIKLKKINVPEIIQLSTGKAHNLNYPASGSSGISAKENRAV